MLVMCQFTGCWQEVEYKGSPSGQATKSPAADARSETSVAGTEPAPETPAATADPQHEDSKFADELAAKLVAPQATSPAANDPQPPGSSPPPDDRYATHPPVTKTVEEDRYATPSTTTTPSGAPLTDLFGGTPASSPTTTEPSPTSPASSVPETIKPPAPPSDTIAVADVPKPPVLESGGTAAVPPVAGSTGGPPTFIKPENPPAVTAPASPAASPSFNTRRVAWALGSKLSLSALANDRGAVPDNVTKWFTQSQKLAELLGTKIDPLPPRPAAADADPYSRAALNYLLLQGQNIGRSLAEHQGADHAALLEIAVKSNYLLVLYQPRAPAGIDIAMAITEAVPRAKLPPELCKPLLDALAQQEPADDIHKLVRKLHTDVDSYLSQSASGGR